MNFLVPVFLFSLSLQFAKSCKCSGALHDAFKKGFNLTDTFEECRILSSEIFFQEENWAGFCVRARFFLFKNWKCRSKNHLLRKPFSVAIVTNDSCRLIEKEYDLDKECLTEFNAQMCVRFFENIKNQIEKNKLDKKISLNNMFDDVNDIKAENRTDFSFKKSHSLLMPFIERRWTSSTGISSAKTTSKKTSTETTDTEEVPTETSRTEETSTKTISTEETFTKCSTEKVSTSLSTQTESKRTTQSTITTSQFTSTKETTANIFSTTQFHPNVKKTCEYNEFFFEDHCYFLISFLKYDFSDAKYNLEVQNQKYTNKTLALPDSTKYCQSRHPKALGLAVETKEENQFILKFLKKLNFFPNHTIFTSGIRIYGFDDYWQGWNLKINKNVLNFRESEEGGSMSDGTFYCIDAGKSHWYLFKPDEPFLYWIFHLICERPYNSKNIQLELHEKCLELYRKSSCYDKYLHSNYCCEKDETGEIWFACPNQTFNKTYPHSLQCSWDCRSDGFFIKDRPTCTGNYICNDSYNSIRYIAPVTRYAISDCPEPYSGHSTWYCDRNRTFLETPDYSLCCPTLDSMCRDTDIFLNVWMGCPSKKIIKKTACPPGSLLEEAFVEWYCQENGIFNNTTPDYSNCKKSDLFCKNKDRYGTEWVAKVGSTESKKCPPSFMGMCFWKCEKSGTFDGLEPDCTKCRSYWMDEVSNKIKNSSRHEEVMNLMENYTKKEDLRYGYGHVINLTAECVTLFKNQNSGNDFNTFDQFLRSYSKIFKNLAGDSNLWLSFSTTNRKEYSKEIIKTMENAAFANLVSKNVIRQKYNATLAKLKTDGFDFFVAYNPPIGSQFPLEDFSKSDWYLNVKEVNEGDSAFAAMGLVMSYSMSSLMFPLGSKTSDLELNSPAITFTVGVLRNGKLVDDPNVVVSISFKHKSRTRFPETKVIKRRLHHGEQPSGVFNSTVCCYYRNSNWSTEGCFTSFTSKDRTNCTCNHLSTIGLLMTIHKYEPNKTLEFVSVICSGITIVSLILALLVFYFVDTVKNDRVLIGKNLCICLLIGHIMLITVMDKRFFNIPDNMCTIYAVLLHYAFMAAFAWMFVEGCHLYRMLILVFDSDIEYRWIYLLIGYGIPLVIVGVTEVIGVIFQEQPYGQDELCWLKTPNFVWAFMGPVIILTSINFCILIIAMKLAISSKRRTEKSNFTTFKLWIKGWISLSTLLGITWLFGISYIHYNETFVYTFVVFNGLQGFFIFLFRCVLSEQYKTTIQKKIKSCFSSSKSECHKKCENVKSETKEIAISGTKSSSDEIELKYSSYDPQMDGLKNYQKGPNIFYLEKNKDNINEVGSDINISLMPTMSEAYLRNRMIARNFSARKFKVKSPTEPDNFFELSYHNIYH